MKQTQGGYINDVSTLRRWLSMQDERYSVAIAVEPDMETKLVVKDEYGQVKGRCSLDSEEAT